MGSTRDASEAPTLGDATGIAVDATSAADPPSLIAHRGFAGEQPENTVRTFRSAARSTDWIELDCRPTADGTPAVFHDRRLDRCTDRSGVVAETPAATLFSTEVLGDGPIPTLEEALDAIPADTGVVLDLKGRHGAVPTGEDERWEWLEEPLATVDDAPHSTLVSTFWEGALEAAERYAPGLRTAYLFESGIDRAFEVAERYGCAALHPPAGLVVGSNAANVEDGLLARARERDLAVNAWTVTDHEEAAALAALGVDGIIADRSDVLSPTE